MDNKKPLQLGKGFNNFLRGDDRIRTGDKGFADLCLTTWPRRHERQSAGIKPADYSERATRFELVAFSLARRRSTTELRPQSKSLNWKLETLYARTQTRTGDTCIFSAVLYRLSYPGALPC